MASQVYALGSVSVGTWQRLQVSVDTVAISFKNDSKYDWLVVFGGVTQPNFTTSPGGQANAHVNALEYPTIWVQAPGVSEDERRRNGVRSFDGNIWFISEDNTAGLAQTGASSDRVQVNIITYGPFDAVPASGLAVSRQTDLTNQPRIITIPGAAIFNLDMSFTAPTNVLAINAANIQLITSGLTVGVVPTIHQHLYIHEIIGETSTVGRCRLSITFWYVDNTNTPIAGAFVNVQPIKVEMYRAGVFGPAGGTRIVSATPLMIACALPPANVAAFKTYCTLDDGFGGMAVRVVIKLAVDSRNTGFIGAIGSPTVQATGDLF